MDADTLTASGEETNHEATRGAAVSEGAGPAHRIITILSPKGGAGKTTVGTNLAVALAARHPRKVVLVDLDLQFGDVASVLRQHPTTTIGDIARRWPVDSANLKLALTTHPSGMYTLCAPLTPAEADDVTSVHVAGVLSVLQRSFEYVVVDTDPGLSERVLSALDVCTDIVMVCATERPSIQGLAKALQALDVIGLTAPTRHFLLNRADAKVGLELEEIERTVGATIDVRVPSSIDVVKATNGGVPIMQSRSNDSIVKAFEQLADKVDSDRAGAAGSAPTGSRRLFKRKG
ncbi:AAA family ATPase [Actinospongicola halichondriae]|uniref:AAA family ATPase n=1 Tax=Actinospongicola halichondriae TaxID=3236844 RepID=UPI003D58370B